MSSLESPAINIFNRIDMRLHCYGTHGNNGPSLHLHSHHETSNLKMKSVFSSIVVLLNESTFGAPINHPQQVSWTNNSKRHNSEVV